MMNVLVEDLLLDGHCMVDIQKKKEEYDEERGVPEGREAKKDTALKKYRHTE